MLFSPRPSSSAIRALTGTVLVGLLIALGSIASPATAAAARCHSGVPGDVNGDGLAEVAVGEYGNHDGGGAVHVFYGHRTGLVTKTTGAALNDQYFTQQTPGVPGSDDGWDAFGADVALGDLNADGCADLAIGAFGENDYSGSLTILYGSPSGITTAGAQLFDAKSLNRSFERFAEPVVIGDLDDDGIDDVAAGANGQIVVLYGHPDGLDHGAEADFLTADSLDLPASAGAVTGAMSVGDFNGNGHAELAIGTDGVADHGALVTVERAATGYAASAPITLTSPGIPTSPEAFGNFGQISAAGDVDGDGRDDLALGLVFRPCEEDCEFDTELDGAVVILSGTKDGLTSAGAELWTQDSPGVVGQPGGDLWGISLAMGRLDAGATDDLVIGASNDTLGGVESAGSITVLLGSKSGLTTAGGGGSIFHQGTAGIAGGNERLDQFGSGVTTAYLQNSKQQSVVIGSFEGVGKARAAGQITQLALNSAGPRATGSRTLNADTTGVSGQAGPSNFFGHGLS